MSVQSRVPKLTDRSEGNASIIEVYVNRKDTISKFPVSLGCFYHNKLKEELHMTTRAINVSWYIVYSDGVAESILLFNASSADPDNSGVKISTHRDRLTGSTNSLWRMLIGHSIVYKDVDDDDNRYIHICDVYQTFTDSDDKEFIEHIHTEIMRLRVTNNGKHCPCMCCM